MFHVVDSYSNETNYQFIIFDILTNTYFINWYIKIVNEKLAN